MLTIPFSVWFPDSHTICFIHIFSQVCHSELHLTTCFQPVNGRIQVQVLAAQNLPASSSPLTQCKCICILNIYSLKWATAQLSLMVTSLLLCRFFEAFFVKVEMHQLGQVMMKKKTRALKVSGGQCQWADTFHFHLATLDHAYSLSVKLYSRSSVRRKQCLGQVSL